MASSAQSGAAGPKPIITSPGHPEQVERKDLASWWRAFKRSDKKAQEQQAPQGIFGVPLQQSIRYANVAISLFNDDGQSYIYGYVPIVVAKCGVYLKEKATDVEGIFRLAGAEKRIKELKVAFDSPDRYGKGLDWTGYTVHDAANILRRYFNQLPEPIIPLEFYDRFRDPLRNHQAQAVGAIEAQSPSVGDFNQDAAIREYQALITELPPLNRQLLLYILDLLAVFASKSDLNKMTTPNLAAIFQPGILSHPQHDMAPQEYRLSQDVLIFLIENQDSFLIGMQGTAADPETVRDVQSGGTPARSPGTPTTPSRSKTVVGRSASNASAGADSVRKWGGVRRNMSVSSKHSRKSEAGPMPVTPGLSAPGTPTSGVHRSNTLPSNKRGGHSPRFSREKTSDPPTPSPGAVAANESGAPAQGSMQSTPIGTTAPLFPSVAPPEIQSPSSSEATTPMATVGSDTSSAVARDYVTPKKDTTPLLAPPSSAGEPSSERTPSNTPSTASTRNFLDIFKQSPTSDNDSRKPNKLQKKRIPGSALSSAQSSAQSLHGPETNDMSQHSPVTPGFPPSDDMFTRNEKHGEQSAYATAQTTPIHNAPGGPQRNPTDATIRPTTSPAHSFHSTDFSDADLVGDDQPTRTPNSPEKEKKKRRWRFSRSQNKLDTPTTPNSGNPLGTMTAKEQTTSRSTVGSSVGAPPRKSFQEPMPLASSATDPLAGMPMQTPAVQPSSTDPVFSDSERDRRGGPMSWIRSKINERKEKDAEKRAKTPERNRERGESKQDLRWPTEAMPVRGHSLEQQRGSNAGPPPAFGGAGGLPTALGPGQVQAQAQAQAQGQDSTQGLVQHQGLPQGLPQGQGQGQGEVQAGRKPEAGEDSPVTPAGSNGVEGRGNMNAH